MALVEQDEMTTLRSASDSLATAQGAEYDIQLKAVAYAINSAANTGEFRTVFQGVILDQIEQELLDNGYELTPYGPIYPERKTVISWGPVTHDIQ